MPVITSASIKAYRSGSIIADADAAYIFPLDKTNAFKGTFVPGVQTDFLLNVYRWYMSPVSVDPPTNYRDWIIVKEWNEARPLLSYEDSDDFTFIPNIDANFDSLDFFRDFGLSDDDIADRFAGRYFVYSVTPYSLIGRVGDEIFSNAISTNKIERIDPIRVSAIPGQYDIRTEYSTVKALMLNGLLQDVNVTWVDPIINLLSTTQGEIVRTGTVTGYADPVEFHLTVDNNIPSILTLTILPDSRLLSDPRLIVPTFQSVNEYKFNFIVKDQFYTTMDMESVDWQLLDANGALITSTDVSISAGVGANVNTATLTVNPSAVGNVDYRVRAVLKSNPDIIDEKVYKSSKASAGKGVVTTVTNSNSTNYTITVIDDQGNPIKRLVAYE